MAKSTLREQVRTGEDGEQFTSYRSQVPKGLVEAMGWNDGDTLEWSVESSGRLSVEVDDG